MGEPAVDEARFETVAEDNGHTLRSRIDTARDSDNARRDGNAYRQMVILRLDRAYDQQQELIEAVNNNTKAIAYLVKELRGQTPGE